MRKLKIVLAAVGGLVIILVAVGFFLLDANRYRGQIEARLQQQLQRQVTVGDLRLRLFPPRFTAEKLAIADDPRLQSPAPFVQTERLEVLVNFSELLRGNLVVESMVLVQPRVELIRTEDGKWNFSSIGPAGKDADSEVPAPADEPATKKSFTLKKLDITEASIAITDRLKQKPRAVYAPIDLSLRDFAPGKPFSFEVTAHMPGAGDQEIHIKGDGGPLSEGGPAKLPLRASVSLNSIDVAGLRQFLDSAAVSTTQGLLSGEMQIDSQDGMLSTKGKLTLDKLRVGSVGVGYPITLDYALASQPEKGTVEISRAELKLGPTPLAVTGSLDLNPNPIRADLRIKTGETTATEVARLAAVFDVAFSPDTEVTGRLSGDIRARGPINNLALEGGIAGRDLRITGKKVAQPIHIQTLDISVMPNEVRSNAFEAKSGDAVVIGRFTLREYFSKAPALDLSLRTPGATLPEIQTLTKAYGITGLDQLSGGEGKLNFDLRAAGPLKSVASPDITKALNGSINLDFATVRIQGFDAMHEVGRIGRFANLEPDKGFTEVIKLAGHIVVKNGVAETTDLEARLAGATVVAAGTSDLSAQTLDLRAMAIFSKGVSDKVGGTKIGGLLTTALSNDRGEIVIPVIISGNMRKPKFTPDARTFLQMQRKRLLPGLDNPRAAISSVLESLKGKKQTEENKGAEEKPKENSIQEILKGILGGKKQ